MGCMAKEKPVARKAGMRRKQWLRAIERKRAGLKAAVAHEALKTDSQAEEKRKQRRRRC